MLATKKSDPWYWAETFRREKISPEDIESAIMHGADRLELSIAVLEAIGSKSCEDPKVCAFLAAKFDKSK